MTNNPFNKETKRFSIITPIYKDAYKTLPQFLQALADQDYREFEVIVIFDGKNRRGQLILEELKIKHSELSIKSQQVKHGGAPYARNKGANLATGDYLTFLDPDVYLYPETLRVWANAFEEHPDKDVVWGLYDILMNGQPVPIGGAVPVDNSGTPLYWAFRFSNYCSGANPIRKEAFVGWDETVLSLQDWDMWVRMLAKDNWQGQKFHYIAKSFFLTEPPQPSGISGDSHRNWLERVKYVKTKNKISPSDLCVVSLGAPYHGVNAACLLDADYLPDPQYKVNEYKAIYLIGFYPNTQAALAHIQVFREFKGCKIIHWIGTDIMQMHWTCSFQKLKALKDWFTKEKVIHLTEALHTQKELAELGIDSQVIPIPPAKLYKPLPLPSTFSVAIYENPTQKLYGEDFIPEVARSLPDIQFKFFGDPTKKGQKERNMEHLGWVEMDDFLPQVSCNVRITAHDGLPLTPLQFLTAGRHVVCNTSLKGAFLATKERKSVVEAIRQAQKTPIDETISPYWHKVLNPQIYKKRIWQLL